MAQGAKKKASSKKKVTKSSKPRKKTTASKRTSKRRKASSKFLSPKEIAHFRELLLLKMQEILGDVDQMEADALRNTRGESTGDLSYMPIHMADIGTDNFEQEFALGLLDSERKLLKEIIDAINRIENGEYGICEGTAKPIGKPRLEAKPWARYSIEYARMVEQGLIVEGETVYDEEDDSSNPDEEKLGDEYEQEAQDEKDAFDIDYFVGDDDLEPDLDDEL